MPLIIDIQNNAPYYGRKGMACFYTAAKLSLPVLPDISDVCRCNTGCEPLERVFYSSDNDSRKNDKTQFMYAKTVAGDSVELTLIKDTDDVGNILSGDYGSVWDGFTSAPLQVGAEIEWKKVYTAHGAGRYRVRTNLRIVGREQEIISRVFELSLYSDLAADKTVKIESYQTGDIFGSPFVFAGLRSGGWLQQYRVRGRFGDKAPLLEQDRYVDNTYTSVQIQDKISREYTLYSDYLSAEVANDLFYTNMLANRILITDYNQTNHERYTRVDVVPSEVAETVTQRNRKGARHTWKFRDRLDNNFKNNY